MTTDSLTRPMRSSVQVARPMFQVLHDDSASCVCAIYSDGQVCSGIAMRVTADDYRRPGRRFL